MSGSSKPETSIEKRLHDHLARLVGIGIGQRTSVFLKGIVQTMSASGLARLFTGLTTLYVARRLGPADYGVANLSLAAALWIQIPLFLGLPTAIMHFVPQSSEEDKDLWCSTGITLFAMTSSLTLVACYVLRRPLGRALGVAPHLILITLLWCFGFALFTMGTSLVNAMEHFSRRAWMELFFAVGFVGIVGALVGWHCLGPGSYVASYAASYALAGLWGMKRDLRRLRWPAFTSPKTKKVAKEFLAYGLIGSAGSVVAALFNAPARLLANHYLTHAIVGILSAYQGGSIQMSLLLVWVGVQVFFPLASRTPNKNMLFKKINRILWISAIPMMLVFVLILALYFRLLGSKYPLDPTNLLIYAFAAYLALLFGVLAWFYAAMGKRGLIFQSSLGLAAGLVNAVACYYFVPRWGVAGAGIAYSIGSAVGIMGCYMPAARRWTLSPQEAERIP